MDRIGLISLIGLCASLAACSQGVESAASFTFDAPDPTVGDGATSTPEGSSSTTDDPTAASQSDSDSASPTTGLEPTSTGSVAETTNDSGETTDGPTTGPSGDCTPGTSQDCYTGPAGTEGMGPCTGGTQNCGVDGTWDSCLGEVLPSDEDCDGEDNDCDGAVDNGNPDGGDACNTGLPGPCQPGTLVCENGGLVCDGNVAPAASETCGNSIDDDCNGVVDNGCSCDPGNPGLDCAANESCVPTEVFGDDATCSGPTGVGTQYSSCLDNADCAPGHVCVNTGVGTVYCMQWCTSFAQCPFVLDDCIPLAPSVYAGNQEWGVCYDGLG